MGKSRYVDYDQFLVGLEFRGEQAEVDDDDEGLVEIPYVEGIPGQKVQIKRLESTDFERSEYMISGVN